MQVSGLDLVSLMFALHLGGGAFLCTLLLCDAYSPTHFVLVGATTIHHCIEWQAPHATWTTR